MTITPPPSLSIIARATLWASANGATRLTSTTSRKASSGSSSAGTDVDHAGVVHEHVDPAVAPERRLDDAADVQSSQIARHRQRIVQLWPPAARAAPAGAPPAPPWRPRRRAPARTAHQVRSSRRSRSRPCRPSGTAPAGRVRWPASATRSPSRGPATPARAARTSAPCPSRSAAARRTRSQPGT